MDKSPEEGYIVDLIAKRQRKFSKTLAQLRDEATTADIFPRHSNRCSSEQNTNHVPQASRSDTAAERENVNGFPWQLHRQNMFSNHATQQARHSDDIAKNQNPSGFSWQLCQQLSEDANAFPLELEENELREMHKVSNFTSEQQRQLMEVGITEEETCNVTRLFRDQVDEISEEGTGNDQKLQDLACYAGLLEVARSPGNSRKQAEDSSAQIQ